MRRSIRSSSATPSITHIFAVHCETTSGILNPVEKIGALAARYRKHFLIDAMSAFGAIPLDARAVRCDAVAASSNKCIEGVPGLGFVICRKTVLEKAKGNATTLVLDLHDQWANFVKDRAIPLHAADPCHRRVPPGARRSSSPKAASRAAAGAIAKTAAC